MASLDESARQQLQALGDFIRHQRRMAEMSLRDLAARTNVSNPYLSQIERGLHEPSVRVLKAIATALNVSAESLLMQAGLLESEAEGGTAELLSTAVAIGRDEKLKPEQRTALLAVYQSYLEANAAEEASAEPAEQPAAGAKTPPAKARGASKKKSSTNSGEKRAP
jgi:transcriptional regulator with XRE-family HTH domain